MKTVIPFVSFLLLDFGLTHIENLRKPRINNGSAREDKVKPTKESKFLPVWKEAIVGGRESAKNEWPWMAALVRPVILGSHQSAQIFCGGSVVSRKFVLTAAHCTVKENPNSIFVQVGGLTVTDGYNFPILRIVIHRNFKSATLNNDISLVQLKSVIMLSSVIPVTIHTTPNFNYEGLTAYIKGWGTTSYGGPSSHQLRQVPVKVVTLALCNILYGGIITTDQICAGTDGKDACQGDSGGPMIMLDSVTNSWLLIGITSFGNDCGVYPGIYTRVGNFAKWIYQAVTASLKDKSSVPRKYVF